MREQGVGAFALNLGICICPKNARVNVWIETVQKKSQLLVFLPIRSNMVYGSGVYEE